MYRGAILSADGRYRYLLEREWRVGIREIVWILLNPSTADGLADDPVGPDNDGMIARVCTDHQMIVAAYGTRGGQRAKSVLAGLGRVWSLGVTKDGHPRHPLYVPSGIPATNYRDP